MIYEGLLVDFDNIRATQPYKIGTVIDEAQQYIEYLEGQKALLDAAVAYLNSVDDSGLNETKEQILQGFAAVIQE